MTKSIILESFLWLIRFLFGACIFRYFGAVADRLSRGENIGKGRSCCTACGVPIQKRTFFGELAGGMAFVLCAQEFGFGYTGLISLEGAVVFGYLGILLAVARIDWEAQVIYNRFPIWILLLAVAQLFLVPGHGIGDRLIGALIVSVPMLVLSLIVPGAFGGGDIKLMAASGFFLGMEAIVCAMFFGLLGGGGYAAYMLAAKKLKRNDQFAFGPFLAFGLALAALWGDRIAAWYLSIP